LGARLGCSVQGSVLLCRQKDQPGIVGAIGTILAEDKVNISFMTVCRTAKNQEAIMAIGIDEEPGAEVSSPPRLCAPSSALFQFVILIPCCNRAG
jgi:formyltetrahydrofolate hydrolase